MVFTCSGCGSRYRIDDDRVTGKSLRVVCKKCHQGHRIRDAGNGSFSIDILAPGETSDARLVQDAAHPTRSMPSVTPGAPGTDRASRAPEPDLPPPPPSALRVAETWYALRKGVRIGPFDREGLLRQLQEGQVLPSSFVWRPTMASWQRLEGVPELADLLRTFLEGSKRAPSPPPAPVVPPEPPAGPPPPPSRTPGPPPLPPAAARKGPVAESREETPPPLPPPPRETGRPFPGVPEVPTGGRLADDLFLDLSRPTIDLRRAAEIQPEEPEQLPRQRLRPVSSQAPRPAMPPPLPPVPPSPPLAADSVSSGEMPLFPDEWMGSDGSGEPGMVVQVAPRVQVPAAPDPHMGVRDFSVMIRHLGRKDRRRNLTFAIAAGGVLLAAGGGLFAWIWFSPPKGGALPIEESASHAPRFETPSAPESRRPRELPRISLLESPGEPLPANEAARSRSPNPEAAPSGAGVRVEPPSKPPAPPPLPASVDEEVRKDTARYGSLIARAEGGRREEAPMADAPKTLETIPRTRMNQELMNQFLEKKHRKFEACKSQMKKPHEGQILVGIAFEVTATGQVQNVQVVPKNGVWDGNLTRCIRDVILEWAFPPQPETLFYQTSLML